MLHYYWYDASIVCTVLSKDKFLLTYSYFLYSCAHLCLRFYFNFTPLGCVRSGPWPSHVRHGCHIRLGEKKNMCRQIPLQAHWQRSMPCIAHLVQELNPSPDFSQLYNMVDKKLITSLRIRSFIYTNSNKNHSHRDIISATWDNVAIEVEASDGNNLHECVANCWLGAQQNGMLSIQCFFFPPPPPQYQLL